MMTKDSLLSTGDLGKYPLSRELELGTDTRGIWATIPGKLPDQSNGLCGGCTQQKCWWERYFKGNLPLPQICCFPGRRNVIVLETFSVLPFILFSVLFWSEGGDKPEMKHFILVSLTRLGNISFFWLDWFQINSEYTSTSPRESAAPDLFLYYGCALRRTSVPMRQRVTFVLANSMGIVLI